MSTKCEMKSKDILHGDAKRKKMKKKKKKRLKKLQDRRWAKMEGILTTEEAGISQKAKCIGSKKHRMEHWMQLAAYRLIIENIHRT